MMRLFNSEPARVLVTGGAGFIGTNVADRLLQQGCKVRVLDSLVRPGSERNIAWLLRRHGTQLQFMHEDVRNPRAVREALEDIGHVVHLAAQVAVTASLDDPREDFSVNVGGTLNVLEVARKCPRPPSLVFTSTNKVYGTLADLTLAVEGERYMPIDEAVRRHGISEALHLDFRSPYGCSKGAADQYVLDYAHSFGLQSVVLRMSCIYGPHQNGTEEQGWVAHFVKCALERRALTLFGDGRQVRDLLYVADLVDALELVRQQVSALSGHAFNIGGGPWQSLSLLELLHHVEAMTGPLPTIRFDAWRSGDQRYYVSDISRFRTATGWVPATGVREGLQALHQWLRLEHLPPGNRGTAQSSASAGAH